MCASFPLFPLSLQLVVLKTLFPSVTPVFSLTPRTPHPTELMEGINHSNWKGYPSPGHSIQVGNPRPWEEPAHSSGTRRVGGRTLTQAGVLSQMRSPCGPTWKPTSWSLPCSGVQLLSGSSPCPPMVPLPSAGSDSVGSQPQKQPRREASGSFPELRRPQPHRLAGRVGRLQVHSWMVSRGEPPGEERPWAQLPPGMQVERPSFQRFSRNTGQSRAEAAVRGSKAPPATSGGLFHFLL